MKIAIRFLLFLFLMMQMPIRATWCYPLTIGTITTYGASGILFVSSVLTECCRCYKNSYGLIDAENASNRAYNEALDPRCKRYFNYLVGGSVCTFLLGITGSVIAVSICHN